MNPPARTTGSYDAWRKHLKQYPIPKGYTSVPPAQLSYGKTKARAEAIHKAKLRREAKLPISIEKDPDRSEELEYLDGPKLPPAPINPQIPTGRTVMDDVWDMLEAKEEKRNKRNKRKAHTSKNTNNVN